jgi:Reverse transcriptase (RNA-dependent DNA polymerase)
MNAPHYPLDRVQSIESLRHPLGMRPCDLERLVRRASSLYFVAKRVEKEDGSYRVLYDTREPLKPVLQRINDHFLRRVIYPAYLTGGVPGKDYTSSVAIHVGAKTVIKEDISKFYPSVGFDVVFDIWNRFFGFADEVAEMLAMLTTRDGHLEQGAPTSGYLANLSAIGVTRYSRHVDDITMSSDQYLSPSKVDWVDRQVTQTLLRKGLKINQAKHEVMQANGQIKILKLLGHTKASLPKNERSRVRAMVHDFCLRAQTGDDLERLHRELPRVQGQAYKVKRFHPHKGQLLVEQVKSAEQLIRDLTSLAYHLENEGAAPGSCINFIKE